MLKCLAMTILKMVEGKVVASITKLLKRFCVGLREV